MSTNALSISELKRIEELMEAMLIEAANGNWQELNRLDSERRVLVGFRTDSNLSAQSATMGMPQHQSAEASKIASDSYQAMCQKLLDIDKQINSMVNDARQKLIDQSRGIRDQVKAKRGYEQTSKAT